MLDMQKAVGCGWEKAEKGDGVQIQWRELGEKGKTNWPNFVLVAMEQFLVRLALTYGAGIGWGDGRTMRERLTAGFPGLSEDEDCSC